MQTMPPIAALFTSTFWQLPFDQVEKNSLIAIILSKQVIKDGSQSVIYTSKPEYPIPDDSQRWHALF
jgi:hypothetical protein